MRKKSLDLNESKTQGHTEQTCKRDAYFKNSEGWVWCRTPLILVFRRQRQCKNSSVQCLGSIRDLLSSSKGSGPFLQLHRRQHTQIVSWDQAGSTSRPLLFLMVVPWHWHLQNEGSSAAAGLHFHPQLLLGSLRGLLLLSDPFMTSNTGSTWELL